MILLVATVNNKHYLVLVQSDKPDVYNIQDYENKESLMKAFSGYTEAFKRDITWVSSACLGMMQMRPVGIVVDVDPEMLRPFIINEQPVRISGGAIGRGFMGIEVTKNILLFEQVDIWKDTMVQANLIGP